MTLWEQRIGDVDEALRLSRGLLVDQERIHGPDHPGTLRIRQNIAWLTAQRGDIREAVRLFKALLPDQSRVLSPAHPETRATLDFLMENIDVE